MFLVMLRDDLEDKEWQRVVVMGYLMAISSMELNDSDGSETQPSGDYSEHDDWISIQGQYNIILNHLKANKCRKSVIYSVLDRF